MGLSPQSLSKPWGLFIGLELHQAGLEIFLPCAC